MVNYCLFFPRVSFNFRDEPDRIQRLINLFLDPILFLLLQAFLDEVAQSVATLTPKLSLE